MSSWPDQSLSAHRQVISQDRPSETDLSARLHEIFGIPFPGSFEQDQPLPLRERTISRTGSLGGDDNSDIPFEPLDTMGDQTQPVDPEPTAAPAVGSGSISKSTSITNSIPSNSAPASSGAAIAVTSTAPAAPAGTSLKERLAVLRQSFEEKAAEKRRSISLTPSQQSQTDARPNTFPTAPVAVVQSNDASIGQTPPQGRSPSVTLTPSNPNQETGTQPASLGVHTRPQSSSALGGLRGAENDSQSDPSGTQSSFKTPSTPVHKPVSTVQNLPVIEKTPVLSSQLSSPHLFASQLQESLASLGNTNTQQNTQISVSSDLLGSSEADYPVRPRTEKGEHIVLLDMNSAQRQAYIQEFNNNALSIQSFCRGGPTGGDLSSVKAFLDETSNITTHLDLVSTLPVEQNPPELAYALEHPKFMILSMIIDKLRHLDTNIAVMAREGKSLVYLLTNSLISLLIVSRRISSKNF